MQSSFACVELSVGKRDFAKTGATSHLCSRNSPTALSTQSHCDAVSGTARPDSRLPVVQRLRLRGKGVIRVKSLATILLQSANDAARDNSLVLKGLSVR